MPKFNPTPDESLLFGLLDQLVRGESADMRRLVHQPTKKSPGPSETLRGRRPQLVRMLNSAIQTREMGENIRHSPGLMKDALMEVTRPLRGVRNANENFIASMNNKLNRAPTHRDFKGMDPIEIIMENVGHDTNRRKIIGQLGRVDQELTRRGDILRRMSRVLKTGRFTGPLAVLMLLPMLAAASREDTSGDEVVGEGLF